MWKTWGSWGSSARTIILPSTRFQFRCNCTKLISERKSRYESQNVCIRYLIDMLRVVKWFCWEYCIILADETLFTTSLLSLSLREFATDLLVSLNLYTLSTSMVRLSRRLSLGLPSFWSSSMLLTFRPFYLSNWWTFLILLSKYFTGKPVNPYQH